MFQLSGVHCRDLNNAVASDAGIIGISSFAGGRLWVEDPSCTVKRRILTIVHLASGGDGKEKPHERNLVLKNLMVGFQLTGGGFAFEPQTLNPMSM